MDDADRAKEFEQMPIDLASPADEVVTTNATGVRGEQLTIDLADDVTASMPGGGDDDDLKKIVTEKVEGCSCIWVRVGLRAVYCGLYSHFFLTAFKRRKNKKM